MAERRRRSLRVLAFPCAVAVIATAGAAAVPATEGCQTHQCDADCVSRGWIRDVNYCAEGDTRPTSFGQAYWSGSEIVWDSVGPDGIWLDYPGERTYWLNWWQSVHDQLGGFDLNTLPPGALTEYQAYVATDEFGQNSVEASGQLAEFGRFAVTEGSTVWTNTGIAVLNASCAEYFLRVVIRLHVGEAAPAPDASVESGADASDAAEESESPDAPATIDAASALDGPG